MTHDPGGGGPEYTDTSGGDTPDPLSPSSRCPGDVGVVTGPGVGRDLSKRANLHLLSRPWKDHLLNGPPFPRGDPGSTKVEERFGTFIPHVLGGPKQ